MSVYLLQIENANVYDLGEKKPIVHKKEKHFKTSKPNIHVLI